MPTTKGALPFPLVSYAAWRASVEAELGTEGASRRPRAMTEDGITIEPLYAPGGPGDGEAGNLAGRVAGLLPAGRALRIRQRFPIGVAADVLNTAIAGGVRSIEFVGDGVAVQLETLIPAFEGLRVPPASIGEIELSLEDVEFESGGLSWQGGPTSRGTDPIGHWLRRGEGSAASVRAALGQHLAIRPRISGTAARLCRASGDSFFDAGATAGMTLGCTMAVALAYLRAMEEGGHVDWAANTIEVRLPCGPRFFESVAMLRAARLIWARILEISGIEPTPLQLVAITGRRTLTRHDPWNNALRNTSVAFAAAIGGADILQLLPHDVRNAESSAAALRLARTTGLILQDEAHLGRVIDPAGGSWFLESLTAELAEAAWSELRRLEAAGGIIAVIESGELSRRIAEAAAHRQEKVRTRRHPIIGVTEHPVEGEVASRSGREASEAALPNPFPFRPDALEYEAQRDSELAR